MQFAAWTISGTGNDVWRIYDFLWSRRDATWVLKLSPSRRHRERKTMPFGFLPTATLDVTVRVFVSMIEIDPPSWLVT